jgi:hypothetical protein
MNTDANLAEDGPTALPADLANVLEQLPTDAAELVLSALACSSKELRLWMLGAAGPAPVPVRVVDSRTRPSL